MSEENISYEDKPWTDSYQVGPYQLEKSMEPYPEKPAFEIIDESASEYPSNNACIYKGNKITYEKIKTEADKLANALSDHDIGKGDQVATILPTSPQFIISDFGIMKTGAAHVPCSILHREADLEHELGTSEAKTVICIEDTLDILNKIKDKTSIENVIVTSWDEYAENPKPPEDPSWTETYKEFLNDYEPDPPKVDINPKEDLAWLAFTGGTTGMPKGTMITHFNLTSNIHQLFPWMLQPLKEGIKGKSSVLLPIHMFHAYGHVITMSALNWGLQTLLVPDPRDYGSIVHYIKEYRPFMVIGVPTQFMKLVSRDIGRTQSLFMSSASGLPPEIEDEFSDMVGVPMTEGYGLTEATAGTHMNLTAISIVTGFMAAGEKRGVGVPLPDTEVKLVDPETKEKVPPGEPGEIHLKGPQIMKGYWPEKGKGLEDGWIATGDIGKMDEDGYFQIEDRIKDTINVSGFQVFPRQVDDVIIEIEGVEMAATIGVPDPERPGSERVKVFAVLKEGYEDELTEDDVIEYCDGKLPPYSVPKFIEFRDDLPRTAAEKIFKRKLKEEEVFGEDLGLPES